MTQLEGPDDTHDTFNLERCYTLLIEIAGPLRVEHGEAIFTTVEEGLIACCDLAARIHEARRPPPLSP
jgi:hypothetical protein